MSGYGELALFYDRLMGDVDYVKLSEYYGEILTEYGAKNGILLDLACGTGTLSRFMAKRGWDVIGADISPEMLSVAVAKADASENSKITYICQDMTELDLYGTVNAAVCAFDGLNHVSVPETADASTAPEIDGVLLNALKSVSLFMEPGGVFVFDVNTVFKHETTLGNNIFIKQSRDIYCVWQNAYRGDGVVDITLEIFDGGGDNHGLYRRYTEEIREKAHPLQKVRELSETAGFEVKACYDFMTKNAGSENSDKVVFVCVKKIRTCIQ